MRVTVSKHSDESGRIYVEGDPIGLRSLAALIKRLADVDQKSLPTLPDTGASEHIHLKRATWLTPQSAIEVVVSRLDDKHGSFDETFVPRRSPPKGDITHLW